MPTYIRRVRSRVRTKNLAMRLFETKKKLVADNEINVNTLTGYHCKNDIMSLGHGTGYASFEGHHVRGRGIKIQGWFKNNATTSVIMRMLVLVVKNGVLDTDITTGNALFETDAGNTGAFSGLTTIQKMLGRVNGDRYICVRDLKYKLGATSSVDGADVKQIKLWLNLKGRLYRHDGAPSIPTRNHIAVVYFPVLGNNDESLGEVVEINASYNYYYVDP